VENQEPKKKPIWKKWWFWVLAFFVLIVIASSGSESQQTPASEPASTQTENAASKAKQQTQFNWATADVSEANIKAALSKGSSVSAVPSDSDFPKSISKVVVMDNAAKSGQKNIEVWYKAGTAWDETDFVKRCGGTAIEAGSILFANPKVEQVALFALTEMTDQYGKTELEVGTKIVLTREIASKVDWKGLAERHVSDPGNIYRITDNYHIHLGILKNVKRNEVQF